MENLRCFCRNLQNDVLHVKQIVLCIGDPAWIVTDNINKRKQTENSRSTGNGGGCLWCHLGPTCRIRSPQQWAFPWKHMRRADLRKFVCQGTSFGGFRVAVCPVNFSMLTLTSTRIANMFLTVSDIQIPTVLNSDHSV